MRFTQVAQTVFVLIAALAVYSFVSASRDGERRRSCSTLCHLGPNYAARNRLAPDFELPTLDHGTVRLSDFRGKTVVLNFWTKTCRPCLEEMPSLAELAQVLADRDDVVVLTISTDESADDARDTLRSVLGSDAPFITAVDPESSVVADRYGTKLFPETWFIDRRGVIRARFDGPRDWSGPLAVELAIGLGDRVGGCDIEFSSRSNNSAACDRITG